MPKSEKWRGKTNWLSASSFTSLPFPWFGGRSNVLTFCFSSFFWVVCVQRKIPLYGITNVSSLHVKWWLRTAMQLDDGSVFQGSVSMFLFKKLHTICASNDIVLYFLGKTGLDYLQGLFLHMFIEGSKCSQILRNFILTFLFLRRIYCNVCYVVEPCGLNFDGNKQSYLHKCIT